MTPFQRDAIVTEPGVGRNGELHIGGAELGERGGERVGHAIVGIAAHPSHRIVRPGRFEHAEHATAHDGLGEDRFAGAIEITLREHRAGDLRAVHPVRTAHAEAPRGEIGVAVAHGQQRAIIALRHRHVALVEHIVARGTATSPRKAVELHHAIGVGSAAREHGAAVVVQGDLRAGTHGAIARVGHPHRAGIVPDLGVHAEVGDLHECEAKPVVVVRAVRAAVRIAHTHEMQRRCRSSGCTGRNAHRHDARAIGGARERNALLHAAARLLVPVLAPDPFTTGQHASDRGVVHGQPLHEQRVHVHGLHGERAESGALDGEAAEGGLHVGRVAGGAHAHARITSDGLSEDVAQRWVQNEGVSSSGSQRATQAPGIGSACGVEFQRGAWCDIERLCEILSAHGRGEAHHERAVGTPGASDAVRFGNTERAVCAKEPTRGAEWLGGTVVGVELARCDQRDGAIGGQRALGDQHDAVTGRGRAGCRSKRNACRRATIRVAARGEWFEHRGARHVGRAHGRIIHQCERGLLGDVMRGVASATHG